MIAIHRDRRRGIVAIAEGRDSREGCRFDAGKRSDAFQELILKPFRAGNIVTRRKQIHSRNENALRGEAGACVLNPLQTLQEETRAREQNETQRHLDQNEGRAEARSSAASHNASRAGFHCAGKIDLARLDRGDEGG